jgi:ABC-2 type transport system permease protein
MNKFKNNFFQGLKDLIHICRMELKIILHDEGVFIFCILVPLGYPLLYSYIYTTELMRQIPVTVIDDSQTSLSREFIRKFDASQWVKVIGLSRNVAEARQQIKEQHSYGFLRIPSDFSDNIVKGKQSYIGLYSDMSGMLYYKGILIASTDVSLEMNKNIKIAESGSTTDEDGQTIAYPVKNREVSLFNPQQGFAAFLIPAVLILIIQQTLLLGIGMAGGTAAEKGEYSELVATSRRNRGTYHIIIGRAIAYFSIYAVEGAYMVCVVPQLFGLVQLSQGIDLLLFMIPFILSCIFFAMALSILMRNREMSILVFVFTSVPLLFISGISWPGAAIPAFWKGVSWLFPSTFGINGFVRINTMGATISQVAVEWRALWLQALAYFVLAYLSCRTIIYRERRRDKTELDEPFM